MIPDLSLEAVGKLLGAGSSFGLGIFLIKWIATFVGERVDKRELSLEKARAAVDEATSLLIKNLQEQITGLFATVSALRMELLDCEHKHAEALRRISQLEGLRQGQGEVRELAAVAVAAARYEDAIVKKLDGTD